MEIYVDTANLNEIELINEYYPMYGVTCNPSIVKKSANPKDFYEHLNRVVKIIGPDRALMAQVVALDSATQVEEAYALREHVKTNNLFVKVPVTQEGLKTIRHLKDVGGFNVTATAIYDTMQAYYALAAGADYVAFYVNRMETNGIDSSVAFRNIQNKIEQEHLHSKIVAAGFHSVGQIRDAFNWGCESITASPDLLRATFDNQNVNVSMLGFVKDWESMYGKGANLVVMNGKSYAVKKKAAKKKASKK